MPKSSTHDTGIDELRRLIRLIGADVNGLAIPVLEFIRAALLAGKSSTDIITVLETYVFPLEGDSLKREDLLPAYVRMGLIGRPRTAGPAMEKIGGTVANVAGKITGMSTEPCNDPAHRGPRKR